MSSRRRFLLVRLLSERGASARHRTSRQPIERIEHEDDYVHDQIATT